MGTLLKETDNMKEPYWYDSLYELYKDGPQKKGDICHSDALIAKGYIRPLQKDETAEDETAEDETAEDETAEDETTERYIITTEGSDAFNKFRDQRLDFAKVNVTQIVSLLVGVIGASATLVVGFSPSFWWVVGIGLIIVIILLYSSYLVDDILQNARK